MASTEQININPGIFARTNGNKVFVFDSDDFLKYKYRCSFIFTEEVRYVFTYEEGASSPERRIYLCRVSGSKKMSIYSELYWLGLGCLSLNHEL